MKGAKGNNMKTKKSDAPILKRCDMILKRMRARLQKKHLSKDARDLIRRYMRRVEVFKKGGKTKAGMEIRSVAYITPNLWKFGKPIGSEHPQETMLRSEIKKLFPAMKPDILQQLAHAVDEAVSDYQAFTQSDKRAYSLGSEHPEEQKRRKKMRKDLRRLFPDMQPKELEEKLEEKMENTRPLTAPRQIRRDVEALNSALKRVLNNPAMEILGSIAARLDPDLFDVHAVKIQAICEDLLDRYGGDQGRKMEQLRVSLLNNCAVAYQTATGRKPARHYAGDFFTLVGIALRAAGIPLYGAGLSTFIRRKLYGRSTSPPPQSAKIG